ncbi:hypothetical protein HDU83_007609 [Entophlyctis luteolus]|nr:hypothetical protein HDU83_007609 [Entophlyctis luteolus]
MFVKAALLFLLAANAFTQPPLQTSSCGFDYATFNDIPTDFTTMGNVTTSDGAMVFTISKETQDYPSQAASTISLFYGTITAKITHSSAPGAITFFNFKNQTSADEIDWEWDGSVAASDVATIMWVGSNDKFTINGTDISFSVNEPIPPGPTHTYELSWTPDAITFTLDGGVVRTVRKDDTAHVAENTGGLLFYYPSTPMTVNIGMWYTSGAWAGGGVSDWTAYPDGLSSTVHSIRVQCYGDGTAQPPSFAAANTTGNDDAHGGSGAIAGGVSTAVAVIIGVCAYVAWTLARRQRLRGQKPDEIVVVVEHQGNDAEDRNNDPSVREGTSNRPDASDASARRDTTVVSSDCEKQREFLRSADTLFTAITNTGPCSSSSMEKLNPAKIADRLFSPVINHDSLWTDPPTDPRIWSVDDVGSFMRSNGISEKNISALKDQDVDGRVVLLTNTDVLVDRISLEPFGQIAKFKDAVMQIRQLSVDAGSWAETAVPQNDAPPAYLDDRSCVSMVLRE